jgi:hypothetical protein
LKRAMRNALLVSLFRKCALISFFPCIMLMGLYNQSRGKTSRNGPVEGEVSNSLEVDDNDGDSSMGSEELSDSGDYIDVLGVFDGRANHSIKEAHPASHAHTESQGIGSSANTDVEEEKDTEGGEVDAQVEEEPDDMLSADEDVNPGALEGLETFVSSLETSRKRKGDDDVTNNSLPRKRKFVEERTAAGMEGEFTAVASRASFLSISEALFSIQYFQISNFGWTICLHRWRLIRPQGSPLRKLSKS